MEPVLGTLFWDSGHHKQGTPGRGLEAARGAVNGTLHSGLPRQQADGVLLAGFNQATATTSSISIETPAAY